MAHDFAGRPTSRRSVLLGAGAASLIGAAPALGQGADNFPNREIRVVGAFPAGSGADVFVRFFAERMKPFLNATMVVENKVGAAGLLATQFVAKARPDGYTIFIHAPSAVAGNMSLFQNPGYDATRDLDVLATVAKVPFTVSVGGQQPWKTLPELIEHVRKRGDAASFAVTAPTGQVAGAMMKQLLGLKAVEVSYRTAADSMSDLLAGAIDYAMYDPIFAFPFHRSGKIRILAISSLERMKTAPDMPTMHEQGVKGVDVVGWWGVMTPKGVPEPIKARIADAFSKMAALPETAEFLKNFGCDPFIISQAEAQQLFAKEVENWRGYVKLAGIKPRG